MRYTATLHFSKPLARQAVFAFWRRTIGVKFILALIVLTALLVYEIQQGNSSWEIGALATILLFSFVFCFVLYFVHLRNSLQKLSDMGTPQAVVVAEETTFTASSGMGSSTFVWSTIKEVWQFPDFWLLLISKAQFMTLPLADIPPEMQSYILRKVEDAGGDVGR